jgi:site-specific recombinase XerD
LTRQYTAKTAHKHTAIITLFIDFICWDTDVRQIAEITRGIANSYFRQRYRSKVRDRTESELKTAMKKFFQFLDREKGIANEAVLKSLQH